MADNIKISDRLYHLTHQRGSYPVFHHVLKDLREYEDRHDEYRKLLRIAFCKIKSMELKIEELEADLRTVQYNLNEAQEDLNYYLPHLFRGQ